MLVKGRTTTSMTMHGDSIAEVARRWWSKKEEGEGGGRRRCNEERRSRHIHILLKGGRTCFERKRVCLDVLPHILLIYISLFQVNVH